MERQAHQPRPSARAAERLTDGVGRELVSLRASLTDALAEAERLEQSGRTDLAVDVLEEQRLVLARAHDQLMGHVSAAAVEREAESIIAAVEPVTVDLTVMPPTAFVPDVERKGLAGRVLVSGLAAVLGLVLLATPEPTPGRLTIAARPATDTDGTPAVDEQGAAASEVQSDPAVSDALDGDSSASDAIETSAMAATVETRDGDAAMHGPSPAAMATRSSIAPGLDGASADAVQGAGAAATDNENDDENDDEPDADEQAAGDERQLEVSNGPEVIEDQIGTMTLDPDTAERAG